MKGFMGFMHNTSNYVPFTKALRSLNDILPFWHFPCFFF